MGLTPDGTGSHHKTLENRGGGPLEISIFTTAPIPFRSVCEWPQTLVPEETVHERERHDNGKDPDTSTARSGGGSRRRQFALPPSDPRQIHPQVARSRQWHRSLLDGSSAVCRSPLWRPPTLHEHAIYSGVLGYGDRRLFTSTQFIPVS